MEQNGTSPPAGHESQVLDVLTGVGLGSLLGMMIGLSGSPVVATFVGAVAAALVSVLGLSGKARATGAMAQHGSVRLASFALSCALVTPVALWMRTHDVLGLSLQQRLARTRAAWASADYKPEDVQRLAIFQELGTLPPGVMGMPLSARTPEGKEASSSGAHAAAGSLFAHEEASEGACAELRRHDFGNSTVALAAFRKQGGAWTRLAERAEQEWARGGPADDKARVQILQLVRDFACGSFD